jgi:exodeoxyribonuclease-5
MVQFTPEQQQAHDLIAAAIARRDGGIFTLHGVAGTGKTTVLGEIARNHPEAVLCALTGKAASVLARKTGAEACTIHSVFYQLIGKSKDEKGRRKLHWRTSVKDDALARDVVLIDECSMVDDRTADDILRTGATIIACGDPGQLPPVRGKQYFSRPDFLLTEIHRQARESAILRQAHAVRSDGHYQEDGPDFRVAQRGTSEDIMDADAILCWTNKTRDAANQRARNIRGLWMPSPQRAEPVVCLKNNKDFGIFNGAVYALDEPFIDGDTIIHLSIDGRRVTVPQTVFRGVPSSLDPEDDAEGYFDFGYAMTVHKAQGSEWDSVVLIDEYHKADQRRQWLYTGITRAAKRILVLG